MKKNFPEQSNHQFDQWETLAASLNDTGEFDVEFKLKLCVAFPQVLTFKAVYDCHILST